MSVVSVLGGEKRGAVKNDLLYGAFLLLQFCVRILPEQWVYALGKCLGLLAYYILPDRRRTAMDNIQQALGRGSAEAAELARESFASLGLLGVEFLRLAGRPDQIRRRIEIHGERNLQETLAQGRGVVLLSAHLGNWELMGQALGLRGYRIHPLVQEQANGRFYAVIDRMRQEAGLLPIARGRLSLREILRALRRGECVSIIPDQDAGGHGMFVPFFGRPASTARGLDTVARMSGAPVVPVFIRRTRPGWHEISFHQPLDLVRTSDEAADALENLTRINRLLEEIIREHPEQWLWMHKRWKTGPPAKNT